MRSKTTFAFGFVLYGLLAVAGLAAGPAYSSSTYPPEQAPPAAHRFEVKDGQFLLDGKPYQVISGEMHYPRVPRAYWPDRFRKAKAMGLNTITTYAFWNVHEPRPGSFDFSGQDDIAEYVREAQAEGLHVILRPGPYVCGEWELGGYPAWLLKDPNLKLRSTDPKYTAAVDAWLARLAKEVTPLLVQNGGPIIAVQLENEYGAFDDDKAYLEGLLATYKKVGLADGVMFTSNQAGDLAKGSLPGLTSVVNFGSGGARNAVSKLEVYRPEGVRMVGEYWAGWFDKWGEDHHLTDGKEEAAELDFLLRRGYSVSLYMFHGGTNFGWMNGADSHTGRDYHPDTTSYDYDAPLDESGKPRDKFRLFQQVIAQAMHQKAATVRKAPEHASFSISPVQRSASLWRNLPMPVTSKVPLTFEQLNQNYGYVLYRTGLDAGEGGTLVLKGMHDYAQIYVDQQMVGSLDRRLGQDSISLPVPTQAVTLDILVENTGRVNYSHAIRTEQTGLTGEVTLAGKSLAGAWEMFQLPMEDLSKVRMLSEPCSGPCFYEVTMQTKHPTDTYLDTRGLHKGQMWAGTQNLGRFWSIGPAFTLYVPAPWLRPGETKLTFFDLTGDSTDRLRSVGEPIFGSVTNTRENQ